MTGKAPTLPSPDPRHIGTGLATLGLLALAAAGYVTITTPQAQQCTIDLATAKVRIEYLTDAKDACKTALQVCVPPQYPPLQKVGP